MIEPTLIVLILLPLLLAVLSFVIPSVKVTRKLVAAGTWLQLVLMIWALYPVLMGRMTLHFANGDLSIDRLDACFLVLTLFVMACSVTHADCYFSGENLDFSKPEEAQNLKIFYVFVNLFSLAMLAVFVSNNLGYLWMSIECATLFSAPLVYFDRTKEAVEATWKYVIICSVGIALALLGTVFVFAASQHGALVEGSLNIDELTKHASELDYSLLRLGFIFCLLGYGTKAGVFPLHSWLPDTYSEAPAPVSAMLGGGLLNCALYGVWRVCGIVLASHHPNLIGQLVVSLGVITLVAGALFLIRQHSFKRMWAYSSIENVGIMLVAIGLGSGALFLLQAINHSIAKVAVFLISGNIVQASQAKRLHNLHGILSACPIWGCLLAMAAFAVTGAPPFGSFVSELSILSASAETGSWLLVWLMVLAIATAFVAVSVHVGRILFGTARANFQGMQPIRASIVPGILLAVAVGMGVMVRPSFWVGMQ
jgi:hydrogenase-4 component F